MVALVLLTSSSALAQRMASVAQEPACAAPAYWGPRVRFARGIIALVLGIAVQDGCHLLTGDDAARPEQPVAVFGSD